MEVGQEIALRAVTQVPPSERACSLEVRVRKELVGKEDRFALEVAFTAAPGISIIFGASGAGKTTLLDCIAGLTAPDSGTIAVGDGALFDSDRRTNLAVQRRKVGYVLQDLALFPHLTVEQNICYGLAGLSAEERTRRSGAILKSFRISHLRSRKPRKISGGEAQRAALARALVTDPCALLLDEPLAALDASTKSKIIADLRAWNEAHRVPVLYVTHNREEVYALGDRVLILDHGRIIADGPPHQVMTAPLQETVAELAGFENIFNATVLAVHPDRGTMSCRLADSKLEWETPMVRADPGSMLRMGIRAGDVLLATSHPTGLSARNIVPGKMISLTQRDMIVVAKVECGVEIEAHLTLAARDALLLQPGQPVWVVVKTYSCHLMTR